MSLEGLQETQIKKGVCSCDLKRYHLFKCHLGLSCQCLDCGLIKELTKLNTAVRKFKYNNKGGLKE